MSRPFVTALAALALAFATAAGQTNAPAKPKRTFEQRQCAKVCEGNDDCRGDYECRMAGTGGSMLLSTNPAAQVRFCSPIP